MQIPQTVRVVPRSRCRCSGLTVWGLGSNGVTRSALNAGDIVTLIYRLEVKRTHGFSKNLG